MSIQSIPHLEGTRILPLFPLPVVLFPGALLPLHIFEERYKRMIQDCQEGDKLFGVTFSGEKEGWPPPVGRIGCTAFILATVPLAEGRMNLLTTGLMRYRTLSYLEAKPYLEGEVEFFQDDTPSEDLTNLTEEVTSLYTRTARATRIINNDDPADDELPDTPEELSFSVAASLQLEDPQKLQFLEMTSTRNRLQKIKSILQSVAGKYEIRAMIHEKAKTNGHGPRKIIIRSQREDDLL